MTTLTTISARQRPTEIYVYGPIDPTATQGEGVSAFAVMQALKASAGNSVTVRVNSPGGSLIESFAILDMLRADGRKIIVRIDGLAASAASVVAMAGDEIIMAENASMFLHKPWVALAGNADELRATADEIDAMEARLVSIYASRTGRDAAEISAMLDSETWLAANDALDAGFATSVDIPSKIAACLPLDAQAMAELVLKKKEPEMTDTDMNAIKAERSRVSQILNSVKAAKLGVDFADELIAEGVSFDQAKDRIINAMAERSDREGGGNIISAHTGFDRTLDNPAFARDAISDAIYSKLSGRAPSEPARQFMSMNLSQMADRVSGKRGWLSTAQNGMHTTSDFPTALGDAVGRQLLDLMRASESGAMAIATMGTVNDFREVTSVRMSAFPALSKVEEAAEIQAGSLEETGEKMKAEAFARLINFSWQALINDDLSAIAMAVRDISFAANELKASLIIDALGSTMSDGKGLFHVDHSNLAASGAAISITTLSAARAAMRGQKGLDSTTPLGLAPRYLLVPSAHETLAQQYVAEITPATAADANPFASQLIVAVEPRLTGNAWYLFADPSIYPALRFVTLAATPSPVLEQQNEWSRLGMSWRCYWSCGAGALDHRGAFKNPGA